MRLRVLAAVFIAAVTQAAAQTDPVIEAARKVAAVYANSLPDYIVKRTTSRYRSPTRLDTGKEVPGWQSTDTISADVTVQRGREVYANIRVNGQSAKYLPGGSWSTGEFAGEIPMVFSPESAAVFSHPHGESVRGHATLRYDFAVDKAHSTWSMAAANSGFGRTGPAYRPAYSGKAWIDKQSGQPIVIEMSAHGLPSGFPVDSVDSHTDYDFVKIGDTKFLLPVRSETTSCGGIVCLKNETEFRDYKKFESNSSVSFDQPAN